MKEPEISIGIVNAKKIHFKLYTPFRMHNEIAEGEQTIAYEQGKILWKGGKYEELTFIPYEAQAFFELTDVVIGIHFHWERKEIQRFNGTLKLSFPMKLLQLSILYVQNLTLPALFHQK